MNVNADYYGVQEAEMNENDWNREVREAIGAADYALQCLARAEKYLNSAGNWGVVDLLGGGFFTTMIKHGKMNEASQELENCRSAIQRLGKELADIGEHVELNIDMGEFLSFADYFFDGLVTDWLAQTRIDDAKKQVRQAEMQINRVRDHLLGMQ